MRRIKPAAAGTESANTTSVPPPRKATLVIVYAPTLIFRDKCSFYQNTFFSLKSLLLLQFRLSDVIQMLNVICRWSNSATIK